MNDLLPPRDLTATQIARLLDVDTDGLRRLLADTGAPNWNRRTPLEAGWRIEISQLLAILIQVRPALALRLAQELHPVPDPGLSIDLHEVPRVEMNLSEASQRLSMAPETLRGLLARTLAPPALQRRPEGAPWLLDSHTLARHLQSCRPALAARLVERLRGG